MEGFSKDHKRVVALDYGSKRIGVALSDELGLTAQPLKVIQRKSLSVDITEIARIVVESGASLVVVGMPYNMDGTKGAQAERVGKFMARIESALSVQVLPWDERLSTVAVTRTLIEGGATREKRKKVVDKLSASYILQGYLDSLRSGG